MLGNAKRSVIVVALAALAFATAGAIAGDEKTHEMPAEDRATITEYLGEGVVGKAVPAKPIGDPIDYVQFSQDGTYAVKKEFHDISKKIARPVVNKLKKSEADHFASDCPMAAEQIAQGLDKHDAENPMGLLKHAYGL